MIKHLRKTTLALGLVLCTLFASARIVHKQVIVKGYPLPCNVEVYVPDGVVGKVPAVTFVPGIGEQDTVVSGLYMNSPLYWINKGWKPNFVVVGMQPSHTWPSFDFVDAIWKNIIADTSLHIDSRNMILTGLSAGASCTFKYVRSLPTHKTYITPIAVISMSYTISGSTIDTVTKQRSLSASDTAFKNLPVWGFCGNKDNFGFYTPMHKFWELMDVAEWRDKPWTTMVNYAHNGWYVFYNPEYKDPIYGTDIYTWALKFKKK
jgi:hypothetical protein